jgi:peptidoglycan/LPS O-acetylase OafA/YrhL
MQSISNILINQKNSACLAIAVLIAVVVFVLTSVFFQNTTYRVLLRGYFPVNTLVTVSSLSSTGNTGVLDTFRVQGSANTKPQYVGTRVMNLPTKNIELRFELETPSIKASNTTLALTQIQIRKPYQNDYYYSTERIDQNFSSDQAVEGAIASYAFSNDTGQITIRSKNAIGVINWPLILGLPILFFIGTLFLTRNSFWSELPAFADMSLGNRISSSGEFDTINGLRGLAALMVLFSHTVPGFEALQVGLSLLFVISGFLLSKPFVLNNYKIFSWANLERYVTKRLKRILPMYYLYIFLMYVMTFKFDTALRHFFFVQAEGHLWPMTQIFTFYMLLPLVLVITAITYRVHRLLPVVLLGVATYFSITLMHGWMPFYNGLYSHEFFLYAFLMGVMISYIQYDLIGERGLNPWSFRWVRELLSIIAILATFYLIAWSAPVKPAIEIFRWVSQFWVKCIACAAIVLLALNTPKTAYRLLITNWLFRSVGVIGFSFYIMHGLGMQIFAQIQTQYLGIPDGGTRSWGFMLGAFFVTYIMSVITYSYVERPFFGYREKQ